MIKKNEIINMLKNAISKHERWMTYAEAMYNGIDIDIDFTPLDHKECSFGLWLHEKTQLLLYLDVPKSIFDEHEKLHAVYKEIFDIINKSSTKSIFNIKKINTKDKKYLDDCIYKLKSISASLLQTLRETENKIMNKSCQDLSNFYNIECND